MQLLIMLLNLCWLGLSCYFVYLWGWPTSEYLQFIFAYTTITFFFIIPFVNIMIAIQSYFSIDWNDDEETYLLKKRKKQRNFIVLISLAILISLLVFLYSKDSLQKLKTFIKPITISTLVR